MGGTFPSGGGGGALLRPSLLPRWLPPPPSRPSPRLPPFPAPRFFSERKQRPRSPRTSAAGPSSVAAGQPGRGEERRGGGGEALLPSGPRKDIRPPPALPPRGAIGTVSAPGTGGAAQTVNGPTRWGARGEGRAVGCGRRQKTAPPPLLPPNPAGGRHYAPPPYLPAGRRRSEPDMTADRSTLPPCLALPCRGRPASLARPGHSFEQRAFIALSSAGGRRLCEKRGGRWRGGSGAGP